MHRFFLASPKKLDEYIIKKSKGESECGIYCIFEMTCTQQRVDDSSTISESYWEYSIQCDSDSTMDDANKKGQIRTESTPCKPFNAHGVGNESNVPLYLSISSDFDENGDSEHDHDHSDDEYECNFGLGFFSRYVKRKRKSDRIAYKFAAKRVQTEHEEYYISKNLARIWKGDIGLAIFSPLGVDIPKQDTSNLPTPARSNVKVRRSRESCDYHISFSCSSEDEIEFESDDEIESCPPILSEEQMRDIHRVGLPPSCLGVDIPKQDTSNLPTPARSNVKVRRSRESCDYHISFSCSSEDEIEFESDDEIESCPPILSEEQMRDIHRVGLPPSCRLMTWTRAYSLRRDGDYFFTMFNKCKSFKHSLVVIKTSDGDILGGYADTLWGGVNKDGSYQTSNTFFGGGQTFLFASNPDLKEELKEEQCSKSLHFYRWTGENYYSQLCDLERGRLGMGGGGSFGFLIEKDFTIGTSGSCVTFGNPPLTKGDDGSFIIVDVEIYGFRSFASKLSDCGSSGIASMSSFVSLSSIL